MTQGRDGMRADDQGLVLVAEDDPDVARIIELNLNLEGYQVLLAPDGLAALAAVEEHRPDLVLLDVMMPHVDGVQVCEQLRSEPATASTPVIMLTAKDAPADRVLGLLSGADDYVIKPFDTMELMTRVRTLLRRNREIRGVSPLTGLPGNQRILDEIETRFDSGAHCAVCYVDVANFKSYNDAYGFLRGDRVLRRVADILGRAVSETAASATFLGHVGGDDFVIVCNPDLAEPIGRRAVELFDEGRRDLYDAVHAAQGYLELADRQGDLRRFPLISLSVGIALSTQRVFSDYRELVAVATEMKNVAKATDQSWVAVDRRVDA